MYPYTINALKPLCAKDFSHGTSLYYLYHNMYHIWYIYGTYSTNMYHTAKPLHIGISEG